MASSRRTAHLTTMMDLSQIISLEVEAQGPMAEVIETRVPREMLVREEQAVDVLDEEVAEDILGWHVL